MQGGLIGRDEEWLSHSILDTIARRLTHAHDDSRNTGSEPSGGFGDDAAGTPVCYSGRNAVERDHALALRVSKTRAGDGDGSTDSPSAGQNGGNCGRWRRLRVSYGEEQQREYKSEGTCSHQSPPGIGR